MPFTNRIRARCSLLCCFAVLVCVELHAQSGTITTAAGNGTACAPTAVCGDGGPATNASLNGPTGIKIDTAGNTFIADTGSNRIRRVDAATGIITTVAGNGMPCAPTTATCGDGGPATSANLSAPAGVATDSAGNIFIADTVDNRIRRVDAATGIITTVAGNGMPCAPTTAPCGDSGLATSANLTGPTSVIVSGFFGDLFIADAGTARIRFVTRGIISTVAGNGMLCAPTTAACGDGGPATSANLNGSSGAVLDAFDDSLIADTTDNRIRRVDGTSLNITTVAGSGTPCTPSTAACGDGGAATSANLNMPSAVIIDRFRDLIIADTGTDRIRLANAATGILNTIAGTGTPGFGGDGGPATNASLNAPHGIGLDNLGNLFIADTNNNRIRRVAGVVTPSPFVAGQVFASVGSFSTNAVVEVFNPDGTLVQILDTGLPGLPAGMAFDKSGVLYVTDFNAQNVTKFDHNGTLLGNFGSGYNLDPESILQSPGGNFFVGQADGSHHVLEFDSNGNLVATFAPAPENRGTDWIELEGDGKTLLYTSEGTSVKSFDVSLNAQNSNFAMGLPGSNAFALKILPDGTILVADTSSVIRLSSNGAVIPPTYTPPGSGLALFALNLDPNGMDFWTADILTGIVYEFDIVSGNLVTSFHAPLPPTAGATSFLQGLAVFGERTPGTADLSVTKTASMNPVLAGSPLTYTVTVANGGPLNATGVVLTDTLPAAVTFNSFSSTQGTCSGTLTITCNLGSFSRSAQATVTINVTVNANASTPITNTANVMGNEPDPNLLNNTATQMTAVVDSLTVTVVGSGSVTSMPAGIDCPAVACSANFPSGTMVVLTATPTSSSTFTGWSTCAGTGTCTVTMNSNQAVTATFINGVNFTLSTGPGGGTSVTVSPGDTAVFLFTLSSVGGFKGKVTLSCASPTLTITCSIVPDTVDIGPGATVTMITVNTACSWLGPRPLFGPPGDLPGPWLPSLALLMALAMVVAVTGIRRRKLRLVSPLAALALFAMSVAGCANVPYSQFGTTPPGTYNLVISASAPGSKTQTITVTLKVI